jgi:hypothetical protein
MINLQQQRQATIDTDFAVRQRMLDNYLSLSQCFQPWTADEKFVARWQELAERSFQIGEVQVKGVMETQLKSLVTTQSLWSRYWLNSFNPLNHFATLTQHWVQHNQRLFEDGSKSYAQAMQGSLEASEQCDMREMRDTWNDTLQRAMDSLEEFCRKASETQQATLQRLEETKDQLHPEDQVA